MKRLVAKVALFVAVCGVLSTTAIVLRDELFPAFPKTWMPGVYGAIGAIFGVRSMRWFDRRWPKPRKGWAE